MSESNWKKWFSKVFFQIIFSDYCQGFILLSALCVWCQTVTHWWARHPPGTRRDYNSLVCLPTLRWPSLSLAEQTTLLTFPSGSGGGQRGHQSGGCSYLQSGGVQHFSLDRWLGKSPWSWINQVRLYFYSEESHGSREFWTVGRKCNCKPHCQHKGILNEFTCLLKKKNSFRICWLHYLVMP